MPMTSIELEFGATLIPLRIPVHADVLTLPAAAALADPAATLRRGLRDPIGCAALASVVREKAAAAPNPRAVIVISDNTRPVPYKGPSGILEPILEILRHEGVSDIVLLVATGTHRALSAAELRDLLPAAAMAADVRVVNHDCTAQASLRCVGRTARGTDAWVNALYLDADIKILTGLVEPHFMAGFSGGRKSVCPGLIGLDATRVFHGAAMMMDPRADSLVLDGNPCHEEARDVAHLAGCDFLVNVTVDRHRRLTGVFCGGLDAAFSAACARAGETNAIAIAQEYDLVVTHAGFAGINHYQAAKAACEAAKAVARGGTILLAANHTDVHPVGGAPYREVLPMLTELGPQGLNRRLREADWAFVPEQWEVQKWAQAFAKVGAMQNLVYCAPRLTGTLFRECRIPGVDGGRGLAADTDDARLATSMLQGALDSRLAANPGASLAILADGPYGVPVRAKEEKRSNTG